MKKNFEMLYERIMDANSSGAYEDIKQLLSEINSNTVVVGAGGSFAVAEYINKCLNCFGKALKPREMLCEKMEFIKYVILVTYSGESPDIIQCLEYAKRFRNIKRIYIITYNDKILIENNLLNKKVKVIKYNNGHPKERSFISIASTLAPVSMFARTFIEKKGRSFEEYLKNLICDIEKEIIASTRHIEFDFIEYKPDIEIIYESEAKSSKALLESNLTETGIAYAVSHEKKDYSHGRFNLQDKKNTPLTIWLKNSTKSPYDEKLLSYIHKKIDKSRILMLSSKEKGLIGEFEAMVKTMYLSKIIAEKVGVDLSRVGYPKEIVALHKFEGLLI